MHLGQLALHETPQSFWVSRVKLSRNRGSADATYLLLCPMVRPREISPLSMRTLNPQAGFEQTHALNMMDAPSRP